MDSTATLLVIITTARMLAPSSTLPPITNTYQRDMTLSLFTYQDTYIAAGSTCVVPEAVSAEKIIKLTQSPPPDPGKEAAGLGVVQRNSGTHVYISPGFTNFEYWGNSDKVSEDKSRVTHQDTTSVVVNDPPPSEPKDKPVGPPINNPVCLGASWRLNETEKSKTHAKLPGYYSLISGFAGTTSFVLNDDQNFLDPIQLTGPKKFNLNNKIKLSWKPVPNAQAYFVAAKAHKDSDTVSWNSSSDKEFGEIKVENYSLMKDQIMTLISNGQLLGPDVTTCTIPAGIFAAIGYADLTVWALGADMEQKKDNIKTQVRVRSKFFMKIRPEVQAKTTESLQRPTVTPADSEDADEDESVVDNSDIKVIPAE